MVNPMVGTLRAAALLTDRELLAQVSVLVAAERESTARLIAVLAELDERQLYLEEGYPSLFVYCTNALHLSEHAAYTRIKAARASLRFPVLLDRLADGSLHVTAVCLLAPHLTSDNCLAVVAAASHGTKQEIEALVARLRPLPPVPSSIRKLPAARSTSARLSADGAAAPPVGSSEAGSEASFDSQAGKSSSEASGSAGVAQSHEHTAPSDPALLAANSDVPRRPDSVKPLAPDMYNVQFTASADTCEKLRLAQNLLRHTTPDVSVAAVVERALTLLLKHLQAKKHGAVSQPRTQAGTQPASRGNRRNRHIPAAVRREVWTRDAGRCAFKGKRGRCPAHSLLEYHHRVPFADGGASTVDNIELRCRAHNAYEADRWFGVNVARENTEPYGPHAPDARDAAMTALARAMPDSTRAHESDAIAQLGPEPVGSLSGPSP